MRSISMRKALIGFLIAATALTPLTAVAAQNRGGGHARAERQQAQSQRQHVRSERQQARSDRRQERVQRREQRVERRAERPTRSVARERVQQQHVQPSVQARQERAPSRQWQGRAPSQTSQHWDRNRNQGDRNWNGNRNRDRQWSGNRNRNGQWDRSRSERRSNHNWNRNWRNDNRYDWQRYRNAHRSIYRGGRYYSPYRNHHYSRFSVGFFLQPLFYSSSYWLSDPWSYRLPPAYPGTRWVRYYDDVLLVDMYSGEVIDVIYDFFW
jgi:hypothetical protein